MQRIRCSQYVENDHSDDFCWIISTITIMLMSWGEVTCKHSSCAQRPSSQASDRRANRSHIPEQFVIMIIIMIMILILWMAFIILLLLKRKPLQWLSHSRICKSCCRRPGSRKPALLRSPETSWIGEEILKKNIPLSFILSWIWLIGDAISKALTLHGLDVP